MLPTGFCSKQFDPNGIERNYNFFGGGGGGMPTASGVRKLPQKVSGDFFWL